MDEGRRWAAAARAGAALLVGSMVVRILAPMFARLDRFGFHDWDAHSVYRWSTVASVRDYGEAPWWNPWQCGGYPSWGFAEGATNFVSPYLPIYLAFPLQVAERLEVLGSAIVLAVGTYLLAGRFTNSRALRALAVVAGALNGRWALQTAVGHTWHLQYAWLPFAFWGLDVAIEERRASHAIIAGAALAAMVYAGGIYPLPHAALALVLYASLVAALRRSTQPLVQLGIAAATGVGLAAPKLFAIADTMTRAPRLVDSTEAIGPRELLRMLTSRDQWFYSRPFDLHGWPWHEYGIYVGWTGVAVLAGGLLLAHRTKREVALAVTAGILLLLGFGAFHRFAPWSLLHHVPPFASQRVPTRFLYPASMLLSIAFAAAAGRLLRQRLADVRWLDAALLVPVAVFAVDVASIDVESLEHPFRLTMPRLPDKASFRHASSAVVTYVEADEMPHALLPSAMANQGVISCYGVGETTSGAIAADAPSYRGEAYVAEGSGAARVVSWSPSSAVVEIAGANAGAIVVYNMSFDPSWRANDAPAIEWHGAVATQVGAGEKRVSFTYRPRTLNAGLAIAGMTMLVLAGVARRARRRGNVAGKAKILS